MPLRSERRVLLKSLDSRIFERNIFEAYFAESSEDGDEEPDAILNDQAKFDKSDCESSDEEMCTILWQKAIAESFRYLGPRSLVPKSNEFITMLLPILNDAKFKEGVRMSRTTFGKILDLVRNHPVFWNNSHRIQADPAHQLYLALFRLGCSRNAASIGKVARKFGVCEGAVQNFTNCVTMALLSLENTHVCWPSERAREKRNKTTAFRGFRFPRMYRICGRQSDSASV